MNRKKFLASLRPTPDKLALHIELLFSLFSITLGLLLGIIAKAADGVSIIGEITTDIGVWILIASLISAYSRYPLAAAINVLVFFLAMLAAYYIYGQLVLGFFPRQYFFGWLTIALLSPIAGFIVWFSRAKGLTGIIVSALPVAFLYTCGYPAFYTYQITPLITILMGITLNAILPKTGKQKLCVLPLSIGLVFLLRQLDLLAYLPF